MSTTRRKDGPLLFLCTSYSDNDMMAAMVNTQTFSIQPRKGFRAGAQLSRGAGIQIQRHAGRVPYKLDRIGTAPHRAWLRRRPGLGASRPTRLQAAKRPPYMFLRNEPNLFGDYALDNTKHFL